ncbi:YtfJ family protein [Vibrio sp. JPW-9-11-11]|uniref:YtfJ family protein n=1 Tax=Vibrio sp. JPW-9-11-11 TaxID=1416532 RepID=UPI00159316A6|nr:YtfJ family protein [Vibrio sp. JPW-9-11-11]NVD07617.1 YtfJ family protein [Vibrio sp. JPW-9-11-11]
MKIKTLLALVIACSPSFAFAHNITLGQSVPEVEVTAYGEVTLNGDDTSFQTWSSQDMLGKVRVIQAIAGRSSAKEMNAALMSAITDAQFAKQSYQTTTIINQDDAVWGTGSFVKSSAQDSKKEFPWSSIILDEEGSVAQTWQLAEESSAIIVQDKQGKVLFVKEGALNQQEIEQVLTLIKQHI